MNTQNKEDIDREQIAWWLPEVGKMGEEAYTQISVYRKNDTTCCFLEKFTYTSSDIHLFAPIALCANNFLCHLSYHKINISEYFNVSC